MEKEDVNNALLHIKSKHNGEIPYKYGSQECAKLMHSYANERVIEELESQQSEPFINFAKEVIEYYEQHDIGDEDIYNKAKKLINGG
jgi:hypothetical protein